MSEAVDLENLEQQLLDALLQSSGRTPALAERVAPALMPAQAMAVYRRLVRGNFHSAIRRALPITKRLVAEADLDELIDLFLASSPPHVRALWQAPAAFSAWCAEQSLERWHPALPELIHFECVELEVLYTPDATVLASPALPTLASRIEADPSARLLAYRFPVHRMTLERAQFPEASATPNFLVVWRADEKMRCQDVSTATAKLLLYCGTALCVAEGLDQLRAEANAELDVDAILQELAALQKQGALVDFP